MQSIENRKGKTLDFTNEKIADHLPACNVSRPPKCWEIQCARERYQESVISFSQ